MLKKTEMQKKAEKEGLEYNTNSDSPRSSSHSSCREPGPTSAENEEQEPYHDFEDDLNQLNFDQSEFDLTSYDPSEMSMGKGGSKDRSISQK